LAFRPRLLWLPRCRSVVSRDRELNPVLLSPVGHCRRHRTPSDVIRTAGSTLDLSKPDRISFAGHGGMLLVVSVRSAPRAPRWRRNERQLTIH
jgi:hypothetical protein